MSFENCNRKRCTNRTMPFTPRSCCSTSIKPTPPRNTFRSRSAVRFTPRKDGCSRTKLQKSPGRRRAQRQRLRQARRRRRNRRGPRLHRMPRRLRPQSRLLLRPQRLEAVELSLCRDRQCRGRPWRRPAGVTCEGLESFRRELLERLASGDKLAALRPSRRRAK